MPDEKARHDSGWLFKSIEQARTYVSESKEFRTQVGGGWRDGAAKGAALPSAVPAEQEKK